MQSSFSEPSVVDNTSRSTLSDNDIAQLLDQIYLTTDKLYHPVGTWEIGLELVDFLIDIYQTLMSGLQSYNVLDSEPIYQLNLNNLKFLKMNILINLILENKNQMPEDSYYDILSNMSCAGNLHLFQAELILALEYVRQRIQYEQFETCFNILSTEIHRKNFPKGVSLIQLLDKKIADHIEKIPPVLPTYTGFKYRQSLMYAYSQLTDAIRSLRLQIAYKLPSIVTGQSFQIDFPPIHYHEFPDLPKLLHSPKDIAVLIQILDTQQNWDELIPSHKQFQH